MYTQAIQEMPIRKAVLRRYSREEYQVCKNVSLFLVAFSKFFFFFFFTIIIIILFWWLNTSYNMVLASAYHQMSFTSTGLKN